jgi:hypothetical protein
MRIDFMAVSAAVLGGVALIWMAPLMVDQFVLFGDREQSRQAADSRQAMAPAAAMLLAGALAVLARGHPWHALFAALPALVAVPLAWLVPEALYQLLAYAISAPAAMGALLASAFPLPHRLPARVVAASLVVLVLVAVVATPFIALLAGVAGLAWWRMPPNGPPRLIGPDWR